MLRSNSLLGRVGRVDALIREHSAVTAVVLTVSELHPAGKA